MGNLRTKQLAAAFFILGQASVLAGAAIQPIPPDAANASQPAETKAPQRWIHGSVVNVRRKPDARSEIIAQLRINTPVQSDDRDQGNGYCRIAWEEHHRGYVACNMLGARAIQLAEVGTRYLTSNTLNPNYSASRAFWIEPSVGRLIEAGKEFEERFLTQEELKLERGNWEGERPNPLPTLRRFKIPEFEAMKSLLARGVIASHSNVEPNLIPSSTLLARWSELKRLALEGNPADKSSQYNELKAQHLDWGQRDPSISLLRQIELPVVRASTFLDEREVGRPNDSTESLSEKFKIPFKAIVTSGPTWLPDGHQNSAYVFGAWDAGAIETELAKDAFKHIVYANGTIRSERVRVKGGVFPAADADGDACDIGFSFGDAAPSFWRRYTKATGVEASTTGPDSKLKGRLFFFYTKKPLEYRIAKISKHTASVGVDGFSSATHYSFDLNRDGIPDLLMWEGSGISNQAIHDPGADLPHYRMAFVNIGGEWHLLAVDEFLYGCGC